MKADFTLAKELSNNGRYIDDIDTLNFDNFSAIALQIYDKEQTLEPSQTSGLEDDFLDVNVKIIDNKFVTKVYHKVDKFNFKVVSFPFPDSNIHSKILSNTFFSQLIRYLNICTFSSDFLFRFQIIYKKFYERGFSSEILKKTLRKFILKHPLILEKYGFNTTSECFDFCFMPRNTLDEPIPSQTLNSLLSSQLSTPVQNSTPRIIVKYSPPKLPNLGNTCYLNAILQVLPVILCNKLLDLSPLMSTSNNAYKNIFDNFNDLFSVTPSSSNLIREICINTKNNLAILYPSIFDNNKQQDAHETFLKICEILDNATKSILLTSSQPDPLGLDYDSIIKKLFFGILKSTEACSSCGYTIDKSESFLNIDINPANNIQKTIISEWNRNIFQKACQICIENAYFYL